MNKYWVSECIDEKGIWIDIDLTTRRVTFCYELDSDGTRYRFSLLSECRDDIQEVLKSYMQSNDINVLVVEDLYDYYTIATTVSFLHFAR